MSRGEVGAGTTSCGTKPSGATAPEATDWRPEATQVALPGTANLRDLGGVPVGTERIMAPRCIYRSEALVEPGTTTLCAIRVPEQADAYTALGVRTVIDLRTSREAASIPSAWPAATGADLVALPIEGGEGDTDYVREIREGVRTRFTAEDLADYYAVILRRRAPEFGAALHVLADPARLPALVHCAAGKDRTGLLVALLLEALGASRDVVVAEYALTGTLRPRRVLAYADVFEGSGVDLDAIASLFDAPALAMATALERLEEEHGSVGDYLREACGVAQDVLARLRENVLAPATPS